MELKTKNRLTAITLALMAIAFYVYALPPEAIEAVIKALKHAIHGG